MRVVIEVTMDVNEEDLTIYDIHIRDNFGNSVNYGDGNYGEGFTKSGLIDSFSDYVKSSTLL